MTILMTIVAIATSLIVLIIMPKALRSLIKFWVRRQWVHVKTAAITAADAVSETAGDLAQTVIEDLPPLVEGFWMALTNFVRWLLFVLAIDILFLGVLIVVEYHEGIIGWSALNAIIALFIATIGNSWSRFLLSVKSNKKEMKDLKRSITRSFVMIFFIMALIGVAEFAVPGIFKYSSWVISLFFWILILFQGWAEYKGNTTGYAGGGVIFTTVLLLIGVGLYNNAFTDHSLTRMLIDWEYSKKYNSMNIMTGIVTHNDTPIFQENGSRVTNKVLMAGDYIEIPVKEEDFLKDGLPIIEFQGRRLVQFYELDVNGFRVISTQALYTPLAYVKIDRELKFVATLDSTITIEGYKEHTAIDCNKYPQFRVDKNTTLEVKVSGWLQEAARNDYPFKVVIDGISHDCPNNRTIQVSNDLVGKSSKIELYTADNRYVKAIISRLPNGVLRIKAEEIRDDARKKYSRTMIN